MSALTDTEFNLRELQIMSQRQNCVLCFTYHGIVVVSLIAGVKRIINYAI